ncbi:MAG TPA: hypothetical protein VED02_02935 [Methyloceanibacter sp.]|nr:hypothetical protein [Methyloceanibacter sp.]
MPRLVPGHGPHAMELPEALQPEQRYLATIAADVRKPIKEGRTLQEATKNRPTLICWYDLACQEWAPIRRTLWLVSP